jgi:hypothetical protein
VGKHQRRLNGVDEIVLSLLAKGRTTGEIRDGEVANWSITPRSGSP